MSFTILPLSFILYLLASSCLAAPAPTQVAPAGPVPIAARDSPLVATLSELSSTLGTLVSDVLPSDGKIHNQTQLQDVLSGIEEDLTEASLIASAYANVLQDIIPSTTPTSIPDVISIASSALPTSTASYPSASSFIQDVGELILNSLSPTDLTENVIGGYFGASSSQSNDNPDPPTAVYPSASPSDAPYSLSESTLRSAIYIPPTFSASSSAQPILMVPGTGAYGGSTYASNFAILFSENSTPSVSPVYLNVPGALLNDAQINAEYVAYAINYLSSLTDHANISVIAWSQGNIDTQWALKYWPSTRTVVNDFICISPDFHGTVMAYLLCPGFPDLPCDPSVIQQEYTSNFITTLRSDDGDSAYVPTTTIYSLFDEIVQPQTSGTSASAYLNDARGVGVSNNMVQQLCPDLPAGGVYTHEGVLYNPLAYALTVDALTHDGPGESSRIDLGSLCSEVATEGLSLEDVVATEGLIPIAAINIVVYEPKTLTEPAIMAYAA